MRDEMSDLMGRGGNGLMGEGKGLLGEGGRILHW